MMKKIVQEVRCYGRIVIDDDVKSSCCLVTKLVCRFLGGIRVANYVGIL